MNEPKTSLLERFVKEELANVPLAQWGFFFPFWVALWRYIEAEYPGTLGDLRCGYDDEPYFEGPRAATFIEFTDQANVLDVVEHLARLAADSITENARSRGFLRLTEVPSLPPEMLVTLSLQVEAFFKRAVRGGSAPNS
jgi:hypothetical protein